MIRFYGLLAPGPHGERTFAYATALAAQHRLRVLPIGMAMVPLGRWNHLFAEPVLAPYVNVVCAPARFPLGVAMTMASSALPPELAKVAGPPRPARGTPVAYEPQTALSGLLTVGCPNVAITAAHPAPDAHDLRSLARYDAVIVASQGEVDALAALAQAAGLALPLHIAPPGSAALSTLLKELCASATSATTAR